MGKLIIDEPTRAQALAIAGGLLAHKQYELAAKIYAQVLQGFPPKESVPWRVRLGLATARSRRTPIYLKALEALEESAANVFLGEGLATWHKTLPFLEDARFMELAEKHAHLLPLPNWHWNLQTALWAAQEAATVPGDFVELGVFKGHTTLFLASYMDFADVPKEWRLYDTFEGIPQDQLAKGWEASNADLYGEGAYSYEEVVERFAAFPNIRVIKGRVPEALEAEPSGPIAFLHIDMNNPSAEIAALDHLFDRVSPGGVILFDDYAWMTARAQYDAERQWFADRGLRILALPTGQGLFVKR